MRRFALKFYLIFAHHWRQTTDRYLGPPTCCQKISIDMQLKSIFPRDAMHKCGLCCPPVSVCRLSDMFVYCIQTAKDIVTFLSRPGSHMILGFSHPLRRHRIRRGTRQQGVKYTGGWKNLLFLDWNRRLSRKRCEIGPWLLLNVNRKP